MPYLDSACDSGEGVRSHFGSTAPNEYMVENIRRVLRYSILRCMTPNIANKTQN